MVGPAGAGKTTSVLQWYDATDMPTAWLSIDAEDDDLHRLASHVIAALQTISPLTGRNTLDLLNLPNRPSAVDLGQTLADELFDLDQDVALVMDECETVQPGAFVEFFDAVLRHPPPLLHLIMISRRDPPLRLAQLRGRGLLLEIRLAELSFTRGEVAALLREATDDIDPSFVDDLVARTGGWVTAVRLAFWAVARGGDVDGLHRLLERELRSNVPDFLLAEVVQRQPQEVQDLLLASSLVDTINPSLAAALLGLENGESRAAAHLAALIGQGLLFEVADDEPQSRRLHPLLRELLQHLVRTHYSNDRRATLHWRACRWYADRAMTALAIRHGVAAGRIDETVRLISAHVEPALVREDGLAVAGWLRELPPSVIEQHAELQIASWWVGFLHGAWEGFSARVPQLRATLERLPGNTRYLHTWRAELEVLSIDVELDAAGSLVRLETALEQLAPERRWACAMAEMYLGFALYAVGRESEAFARLSHAAQNNSNSADAALTRPLLGMVFLHRVRGAFQACADAARELLAIASAAGLPISAGWCRLLIGLVAFERDDLNEAAAMFSAVIQDQRRIHLICLRQAMFGLAIIQQERGDADDAFATMRRLKEVLTEAGASEQVSSVRAEEALLALRQGDLAASAALLANPTIPIDSGALQFPHHPLLVRIELLLALGGNDRIHEALETLDEVQERIDRTRTACHVPRVAALRAIALDLLGATQEADSLLEGSFLQAGAHEFLRTYVDVGPRLVPIMRRVAARPSASEHLRRVLHRAEQRWSAARTADAPVSASVEGRLTRPQIDELLTGRELTVLGLLSRQLTYREIGDEMFISPFTVKRHVTNVYAKLGVNQPPTGAGQGARVGLDPGRSRALIAASRGMFLELALFWSSILHRFRPDLRLGLAYHHRSSELGFRSSR